MDRVCVPKTLLSCMDHIKVIVGELGHNKNIHNNIISVRNIGIFPP